MKTDRLPVRLAGLALALFLTHAGVRVCAQGAQGVQETPGTSGTPEPGDAPASVERLPLGMNLRMVGPRNRDLVFVDAMKSASEWRYVDEIRTRGGTRGPFSRSVRPPQDDDADDAETGDDTTATARDARAARGSVTPVPEDEHGWPLPEEGRPVAAFLFGDMRGRYPGGTYVCTWEGTGRVDFDRAARVTHREEQRCLVQVQPDRGDVLLTIEESDPADPVRDVHFWMPGFEDAASPFHPLFLERLAPFQVVRFYPWGRCFTSSGDWGARTTLDSARQSGTEGVAVEYMVDLCNELGAEPWFCIPHTASDEYVRGFAEIVRDRLHDDAQVWVEYSNEVWNGIFPQARWARAQARERGIRATQVTAEESARVWRIWREVFGDQADRVVRVASGQLHNPAVARGVVEHVQDEVDAIAIGAYFGVKAEQEGLDRSTTAEELLEAARENMRELVFQRIADHRRMADVLGERRGRPVKLVSYEGGQHLVARRSLGQADRALVLAPGAVSACQSLPAMYDAYRDLLDGARRSGLELFIAYDFVGGRTPADTFGHLEYLNQPLADAPKFRALVADWLDATPSPPPDEGPPEPVSPGDPDGERRGEQGTR